MKKSKTQDMIGSLKDANYEETSSLKSLQILPILRVVSIAETVDKSTSSVVQTNRSPDPVKIKTSSESCPHTSGLTVPLLRKKISFRISKKDSYLEKITSSVAACRTAPADKSRSRDVR